MDNKEITYLKKVFASFGCKDASIVQVETGEDLLSSFAVNTTGISIESPACESFLSVGDYPYFAIAHKKGDCMQIDFCMDLLNNIDYVVNLYLQDDFDDLGVYFIDDENEVPYCVEFGAIIDGVFVENFGTINSGKIFGRAVSNAKSNRPFKEYFKAEDGEFSVFIDEPHLNNIMDLRMVNGGAETYADTYRFATTIDQLNDFIVELSGNGSSFEVVINTHLVPIDEAEDAEEEFEHSINYWRGIYEVGLEE